MLINLAKHLVRGETDTLSCAKFMGTAYSFPVREALYLFYRGSFACKPNFPPAITRVFEPNG